MSFRYILTHEIWPSLKRKINFNSGPTHLVMDHPWAWLHLCWIVLTCIAILILCVNQVLTDALYYFPAKQHYWLICQDLEP